MIMMIKRFLFLCGCVKMWGRAENAADTYYYIGFMSKAVIIQGGRRLEGEVEPIPNKNSLMAALPAALLTREKVVFRQVPKTSDVDKLLQIMEKLGVEVERQGSRVEIKAEEIKGYKIDKKLAGEFRGSLMFAGPLLARKGRVVFPMPGGCVLGFRSIAAHLDAFRAVGVEVIEHEDGVEMIAPEKIKEENRVWQLEASVTASENLLMYAAGIEAKTEVIEVAGEPHVVDLERMLVEMGADIKGVGSNRVYIKGGSELGGVEFTPRPDFVDIAGFIVAAAVTDGRIRIKGANIPDIVDGLVKWFEMFDIVIERDKEDLVVRVGKEGLGIDWQNNGFPLAAEGLPKLSPRPWPGFPVDVIPVVATLASKTKGKLLLQNWMYESGFEFVRELNALGADIFISDPQRIIIHGPVSFKGGEVYPPAVIQATKAVFLAALCDPVETIIHGVDILKRRYPDIFNVYRGLGARIGVVGGGKIRGPGE